jgi:hypothetical protein
LRPSTLWILALTYLAIAAALATLGAVTLVWKTFILPGLLIVAALSSRFRSLLADWLPFLGLTVLFDALRAFVYVWIVRAGRPIRMEYPIDADRALFQTPRLIPAVLQDAWFDGRIGWLEYGLVAVHASHFVLFFAFGFWLWRMSRPEFARFTLALALIMIVGLVGYALVPTMPPWMAAAASGEAASVIRIAERVYVAAVPALLDTFDTNPVAAMPSLHMAFPVLMALLGVRVAGARMAWLWGYVVVVAVMLVYLGEHYVVDLLAGAALAGVVFLGIYRTRIRAWMPVASPALGWRAVVTGGVMLVVAEVIGQVVLRAAMR